MIGIALSTMRTEGQRNELERFYFNHKDSLYLIAFLMLHNDEDAEDAVQEVFSEIADKPDKFFELSRRERLAYTDAILRNIAADMFKRKNKVLIEGLDEDIEYDDVSLEDTLFDEINRDEIVEFINRLPEKRRDILTLHCFFDVPIDEISQRLNISPATARKHLALARKAIRKFINERKKLYE